jgi:hypothetical protein
MTTTVIVPQCWAVRDALNIATYGVTPRGHDDWTPEIREHVAHAVSELRTRRLKGVSRHTLQVQAERMGDAIVARIHEEHR